MLEKTGKATGLAQVVEGAVVNRLPSLYSPDGQSSAKLLCLGTGGLNCCTVTNLQASHSVQNCKPTALPSGTASSHPRIYIFI